MPGADAWNSGSLLTSSASAPRESTPSITNTFDRCVLTVRDEISSARAISLLVL
jgi:hypothetical protein